MERSLVTILFADIQGYTALMRADQGGALSLLSTFKDILEHEIEAHGGTIVQYYGDGSLVTFPTATQAVECARDMQLRFLTEEVPVRSGIHLGEIVSKDGNIFGDGVNLASRIESMSTPGAVLVSKAIRDQVRNQAGITLESLGSFSFKNIDEPTEVFSLVYPGLKSPKPQDLKGGKFADESASKPFIKALSVTLACLVVLAVYALWPKSQQNPVVGEDGEIAIFPFSVQGSEDIQYLGEGIVDLLATKLDGIPNLKPVDPNRIFSEVEGKGRLSTVAAADIAARFPAGSFILGSIIQLGDQLEISASKYGSDGNRTATHTLSGPATKLPDQIDDLCRELLADDLEREGAQVGSLAAMSSQSLPAIKSFLLGERALRKNNPEEAATHYSRATEIDSTFGLAWLRTRNAMLWGASNDDPSIIGQINKYRDRLPLKFQDVLSSVDLLMSANPKGADFIRLCIRKHGDSREFSNELGEYLFHINPVYGKPSSEAKSWLKKSRELNPLNQEANVHLAHLALLEEDGESAARIVKETDTTSIFWPFLYATECFLMNRTDDSTIERIALHPSFRNWALGLYLVAPDDPSDWYSFIDRIFQRRGDARELDEHQLSEGIFGKEKELFDRMQRMAMYDHLSQLELVKNRFTLPAVFIVDRRYQPFSEHYADLRDQLQGRQEPWAHFSMAKFSQALGDEEAHQDARRALLDQMLSARTEQPASYFLYSLDASMAFVEGDNDLCLALIDSAYQHDPGFFPAMSFCMDKTIMRAEIAAQNGDWSESIRLYENIPVVDAFPLAKGFATYRLSSLYEEAGQYDMAIRKCDILSRLYQDCDQKYRTWVVEVDERAARLRQSQL